MLLECNTIKGKPAFAAGLLGHSWLHNLLKMIQLGSEFASN
jgi:hypothetical protein